MKSLRYFLFITMFLLAIVTFWSWRDSVGKTTKRLSLRKQHEDFKIIDRDFWEKAREQSDIENLYLYYVKTDSSFTRLLDVVSNDYAVINERMEAEFASKLNEAGNNNAMLIKLLSKGGEGKSTFLYQIAKKYFDRFNTILLQDINNEVLMRIEEQLISGDSNHPVLLILDNAEIHGENLVMLAPKIVSVFRKYRFVFVVAERDFRYEKIENIVEFETNFNSVLKIDYTSNFLREQIFNKLFAILHNKYGISYDAKEDAHRIYISDSRQSISECTFAVIKYLRARVGTKFTFDWEDWEEFAKYNSPGLQRLYLVISTFYQFGYNLDINFCATLLDGIDYITINSVLNENPNLPIYKYGNRLQLRHETLAAWYLDASNERTKRNRDNSERIFDNFLENITTPFARDVFIRLCIKSKDFRTSYLAGHVNDTRRILILRKYLHNNPTELKCRTELAKIYQYQEKHDQAEKILLELLSIDKQNLQARTELAKIYQYQKKYDQAEKVLKECLFISPNDLNSRTELAKIYHYQGKYDQAEKLLLELLDIDPKDFHAMAEIVSVYDKTNKPEKCFEILDSFLKNAHVEKRREPQAMFNNVFKLCFNHHLPNKAQEYFRNYSKVLDSRNILLVHRLFEF